jgi:zinc protease
MLLKLLPVLLLGALLITVQISCSRPGTTETSPTASESPTEQAVVDQILKRYEEALGGQGAVAAINSLRMKGTYELAGITGTVEGWRKEPHKTLTVIEFPRIGTLKKGFDGENRWVQTPLGTYADNSSQEIAEVERDAEVFSAGKIKSLFESMKLENRPARLNGRDMLVIEGTPAKGPAERLFFDKENGLLVRWDMARRVPNRGTVFVKVHLEDYKDVAGVKMPFNIRFAFESFNFRIKVDEMQPNVAIDDAMFKKP